MSYNQMWSYGQPICVDQGNTSRAIDKKMAQSLIQMSKSKVSFGKELSRIYQDFQHNQIVPNSKIISAWNGAAVSFNQIGKENKKTADKLTKLAEKHQLFYREQGHDKAKIASDGDAAKKELNNRFKKLQNHHKAYAKAGNILDTSIEKKDTVNASDSRQKKPKDVKNNIAQVVKDKQEFARKRAKYIEVLGQTQTAQLIYHDQMNINMNKFAAVETAHIKQDQEVLNELANILENECNRILSIVKVLREQHIDKLEPDEEVADFAQHFLKEMRPHPPITAFQAMDSNDIINEFSNTRTKLSLPPAAPSYPPPGQMSHASYSDAEKPKKQSKFGGLFSSSKPNAKLDSRQPHQSITSAVTVDATPAPSSSAIPASSIEIKSEIHSPSTFKGLDGSPMMHSVATTASADPVEEATLSHSIHSTPVKNDDTIPSEDDKLPEYAYAISDFSGDTENQQLQFNEGDLLRILPTKDELQEIGWLRAVSSDGNEGIVPLTYIDQKRRCNLVVTLYDFADDEDGYLSFTTGQRFLVNDAAGDLADDWYFANSLDVDDLVGHVPKNYTEIQDF